MTDVAHDLFRETRAARTLLAQLADIIGDDQQAAADAVEGETSLLEAIDAAVQHLVNDYAAMKGIDAITADLTKRRDRIESRITHMRTALCVALEQAGRKSFEHAAVTLTLKNAPRSVVVTNEAAVPSRFWKPADPKLSKRDLLEALKDGQKVDGAELSNGGVVMQVRFT